MDTTIKIIISDIFFRTSLQSPTEIVTIASLLEFDSDVLYVGNKRWIFWWGTGFRILCESVSDFCSHLYYKPTPLITEVLPGHLLTPPPLAPLGVYRLFYEPLDPLTLTHLIICMFLTWNVRLTKSQTLSLILITSVAQCLRSSSNEHYGVIYFY